MPKRRKRNPLVPAENYIPDLTDSSDRGDAEIEIALSHTTGGALVETAMGAVLGDRRPPILKIHAALDNPKVCYDIAHHAARFYPKGNKVSTHFVIGWRGEKFQTLDEDRRAWSAGIKPHLAKMYEQGFDIWSRYYEADGVLAVGAKPGRYKWWLEEYKTITGRATPEERAKASPFDLFRGKSPDATAISIDFLAPPYRTIDDRGLRLGPPDHYLWRENSCATSAPYTIAQHNAVREILKELDDFYPGYARNRQQTLTHSVLNPISRHWYMRCADGKYTGIGWDPGAVKWDWLLG